MHIDQATRALQHAVIFSLLSVAVVSGNSSLILEKLLRMWKKLHAPLRRKKSIKPGQKTEKFWEIDMTKFEP